MCSTEVDIRILDKLIYWDFCGSTMVLKYNIDNLLKDCEVLVTENPMMIQIGNAIDK